MFHNTLKMQLSEEYSEKESKRKPSKISFRLLFSRTAIESRSLRTCVLLRKFCSLKEEKTDSHLLLCEEKEYHKGTHNGQKKILRRFI